TSQSVDFDVFHYIWFCVKLIQLVVESSTPIVFNLYSTKNCSKYSSLKNKKCLFVCLSHAPRFRSICQNRPYKRSIQLTLKVAVKCFRSKKLLEAVETPVT